VFRLCTGKTKQHFRDLSPAEDYKWLISYKLNPDHQNLYADTAVEINGLRLKPFQRIASTGMYRFAYMPLPQEEFYFDVDIPMGKKIFCCPFDSQKGLSIVCSKEIYFIPQYFKEVHELEKTIVQFYPNQIEIKYDQRAF